MVYAILNCELVQPNWPVSGSANRLKKAVAEVNRLWIQTPAAFTISAPKRSAEKTVDKHTYSALFLYSA